MMDFRMDRSSWLLILLMMAILAYYLLGNSTNILNFKVIALSIIICLLVTLAIIAMASIPVLIYCYFIKKIPDIDYSIRLGAAGLILGFIFERFI
jgi:hypothetical protein